MRGDTLALTLEVREASWRPEGPEGEVLLVHAFTEAGREPQIPGPLIRVPVGSVIRARVHNILRDSALTLYGLHARPSPDTLPVRIGPGQTREVQFRVDAPGTYYYWGSTTGRSLEEREWLDSQLSGAIVVDSAGSEGEDRVFVLGLWSHLADSILRGDPDTGEVMVINGRAWPHTERLQMVVGDSARWRWINPTSSSHPMHLHGVFFQLDSRGDAAGDTVLAPGQRPLIVTQLLPPGGTMAMRWSPARPGNWLFHCHFAFHVSPGVSMDPGRFHPSHPHRMAGLVLGITATGGAESAPAAAPRRIRLLAQGGSRGPGTEQRYAYLLDNGTDPKPDSVPSLSPTLVLERGQPVAITVVNRLAEPTSVHWHGMELDSYFDGVPGLSGIGTRMAPMIAPGDSFTARFTPPRAGTFIYHSHSNEEEQLGRGLYGALLVLAPGTHYDPTTDKVILVGEYQPPTAEDSTPSLVNGEARPSPLTLAVGRTYRLRLINIDADHRIRFTLLHDGALARWQGLALDGADLPPALAVEQPATLMTGAGQTADFLLSPGKSGDWRLTVEAPFAGVPWTVTLPLRVQ